MASIQEEASGKKGGEIRYLTPLNIDHSTTKKYCRFKKYGIKYVDYKDSGFLLKFINEQGKLLQRRNIISNTRGRYNNILSMCSSYTSLIR